VAAAARYRRDWLPHADWVELEGVGHCPQLDVPLETAELILASRHRDGVRDVCPHRRAGARRADDLERAAERLHPVREAAQSGPAGRVGAANPVVGDLDRHAAVAHRDPYTHRRRRRRR
jgi:hypothetical protein